MTGAAGRLVWAVGSVLWIVAIVAGAAVAGREGGVLPHVLPIINTPVDEEGTLLLALGNRPATGPVADCKPVERAAVLHPLQSEALAKLLERGTVLVLTQTASGSGFFISQSRILTNRHVVADQRDGRVVIASKSLGHIIFGKVIATTGAGEPGAPDFAVIEVEPVPSAQPLSIGPMVAKLQRITVAGYPGLSMQTDSGFSRLMNGDVSAAPGLRLSEGSVSNILSSPSGLTEIDHSAEVFHGNSGGPLVDSCGRAVGINTFIAVDQDQSGRINYALSSRDFVSFLRSKNIPFDADERTCS